MGGGVEKVENCSSAMFMVPNTPELSSLSLIAGLKGQLVTSWQSHVP